jgi:hypothetical protein
MVARSAAAVHVTKEVAMLRLIAACGAAGVTLLAAASLSGPGGSAAPASPPAMPAPAMPAPAVAGVAVDSFVTERDSLMKDVLARIAGRENAPAESVFKNIKLFRNVPAGRIPRMMNFGFGHSLGVRCAHCHVENHWADEDKPQKQIARDMVALVDTINSLMLPRIRNLKSEHPLVTCTTCHRGSRKPATTW